MECGLGKALMECRVKDGHLRQRGQGSLSRRDPGEVVGIMQRRQIEAVPDPLQDALVDANGLRESLSPMNNAVPDGGQRKIFPFVYQPFQDERECFNVRANGRRLSETTPALGPSLCEYCTPCPNPFHLTGQVRDLVFRLDDLILDRG